ncbi:MAG: hypothetical protein ACYS6W_01260 [Planctomycetota bacterium]|jgi:hypothetical protein
MRIRFIKSKTGPYGFFPKGREVDLPPHMLATIPKDCYEEVRPVDGEIKTEAKAKDGAKTKEGAADGPKGNKIVSGRASRKNNKDT